MIHLRRILLAALIVFAAGALPAPAHAEILFGLGSTLAADCDALTTGSSGTLCVEPSGVLYSCQPSAGACDTPAEWIVSPGGGGGGIPATVVSPAATDAVGAVGVDTDYAREDHRHPTQTAANTPSTATGDVAAVTVQTAIAELASEKLAAAANNDADDNLANNSIDDLSDVDTSTAAPGAGQHLSWNGSAFVPADPPGVSSAPQYVADIRLTDGGGVVVNYDSTTPALLFEVGAGSQWNTSAASDTTCLVPDVAGTDRGKIIYGALGGCPASMLVACKWDIFRLNNGVVDDTGEFVYFGLTKNGAFEGLQHQLDCQLDDSGGANTRACEPTSGHAIFSLSAGDEIALAALGYSSAGDVDPIELGFICEEAGSTGQSGTAGVDGDEQMRLWLEAPANGTLANLHRVTTAYNAGALYCVTDTGSADVQLVVDDGTPANMLATALTCGSTEASTTSFGGANGATLPSGAYIDVILSGVTGSPGNLTITMTR